MEERGHPNLTPGGSLLPRHECDAQRMEKEDSETAVLRPSTQSSLPSKEDVFTTISVH